MNPLETLLLTTAAVGVPLALAVLFVRRVRRRSFVELNPRFRAALRAAGLARVEQFLALEGTIVSGHPDRNVQCLTLDEGGSRLVVYLKREHRIGLRVRVANALAGFGFVSRSVREALLLDALQRETVATTGKKK